MTFGVKSSERHVCATVFQSPISGCHWDTWLWPNPKLARVHRFLTFYWYNPSTGHPLSVGTVKHLIYVMPIPGVVNQPNICFQTIRLWIGFWNCWGVCVCVGGGFSIKLIAKYSVLAAKSVHAPVMFLVSSQLTQPNTKFMLAHITLCYISAAPLCCFAATSPWFMAFILYLI